MTGLGKIIRANDIIAEQITAFIDEGIQEGVPFDYSEVLSRVTFQWKQSSANILGIQLADCLAHILSTRLLEKLGIVTKLIKAGANSGYDENLELTIGDELFARTRRLFFTKDSIDLDAPHDYTFSLKVGPYAIYAAPSCDDLLRRKVYECFGTTFVGCMH